MYSSQLKFPFRLHAWGDTLKEAFEQCANAMFGYITTIDYVEMKDTLDIEAEGHDMDSLLYNFLDELLFNFCAEPYFIARVSSFRSTLSTFKKLRVMQTVSI